MELKKIFEKIDFVNRYRSICEKYNDFDNSMDGNNRVLTQRVLDLYKYKNKYFSNGSFYQIKEEFEDVEFILNLVLKQGIVETLLYIKKEGKNVKPNGRIDFLPEDLGIPYDRLKYGLPKYSSEKELEEILKVLFSIYEDIKTEFLKQYC
ncbi:hypothetical protein [Maribacter luteus]|uniref:hypothetical protein n=1 Tax=Maribacter luteus TaxID=2594478 RepID=UPI0024912EAC|nr:hypothetical protein [Maribacter luteus]